MRRDEQICPAPDAYRFVEGPCQFGAWEGIVLGIHVKLANWGSMKKKQTSDSIVLATCLYKKTKSSTF